MGGKKDKETDHHRYGVILDAGSSGTRVYVYKWSDPTYARKKAEEKEEHRYELQRLPKIKTKDDWIKKVHPGISEYADKIDKVGEEHLDKLFKHAKKYVPEEKQPDTPIFLLATAGMRLVEEEKRKKLLDKVCKHAKETTDFYLPDCEEHIQVIPGETEGLYGWLAANYLVGGLDNPVAHNHGKNHHTYGFLDMGGASSQIAYAPNATETEKHADDLKLLRLRNLDGTAMEHKVFVTTWLGFGVNEARKRYVNATLEASGGGEDGEIPDPCLPKGLMTTLDGKELKNVDEVLTLEDDHYLLGTGDLGGCERQLYPLLDKEKPCTDQPCLLNGQHAPAIDFDVNHFLGVSEYWHSTVGFITGKQKDGKYDAESYQKKVLDFCSRPWDEIEADALAGKFGGKNAEKRKDVEKAMQVCFKASWIINVLHSGIGVPRIGIESYNAAGNTTEAAILKQQNLLDPFKPSNKINGTEISWTLGRVILWASSQVPPPESLSTAAAATPAEFTTLFPPVGFGDNKPHAEFHLGGPPIIDLGNATHAGQFSSSTDKAATSILPDAPPSSSPSSHKIPTGIFFLLLSFFFILLLSSRDRRHRWRKYLPFASPSHLSRVLRRKGPGVAYHRVTTQADDVDIEAGIVSATNPPRFELGSWSGSGSGNSSSDEEEVEEWLAGGAGRKVKSGGARLGDGLGAGGVGLVYGVGGLGGSAASSSTRLGMGISRTESRERLSSWSRVGSRVGSRSASPMPRGGGGVGGGVKRA